MIGVGGDGAALIDCDHAVYGDFPLILALISVATFLLLTRAFRSVLLTTRPSCRPHPLTAAYSVLDLGLAGRARLARVWGVRPPARSRCGCR